MQQDMNWTPQNLKALAKELFDLWKEESRLQTEWISGKEAMCLLGIRSKVTLQKLRDTGKIRFTQPQKKNILYDRKSILDYLEDNVYETF